MQSVKVFADYDRIEENQSVVADQDRNLSKWIGGEHGLVSKRWTRLVVNYFNPLGNRKFMRHHKNLSGVGGMRLVEKFHRVLALRFAGMFESTTLGVRPTSFS